jgi:pteridine reductase
MELRGCVSLVTGGGRRVGGAISKSLAAQGSDLAIHYRHSRDEAESTAEELSRLGVRVECFAADLSQPDEIEALFDSVGRAFGRLDVLVNSAASFETGSVDEIDAEAWDWVQSVNLRAPFLCTRAGANAIRSSKRDGSAPGLIANIADLSGVLSWPGYAHHGSAKAGLLHLTRVTARELAPEIRVNSVIPGPVLPPPGATFESKEWLALCRRLPVGRGGNPSQIGDTVVFLAQNDFIVGASIVVDGGEHLLGASHRK